MLEAMMHKLQQRKLTLYKALVALLGVVALLLTVIILTIYSDSADRQQSARNPRGLQCQTPVCIQTAAHMLSYMNKSIKPCQDFYQHACGMFNHMHPRGPLLHLGVHDLLAHHNQKRLADLLQSSSSYRNGTSHKKVSDLFTSCMAIGQTSTESIAKLSSFIASLGGMQLFGTWSPHKFDLQRTLTELVGNQQVSSFFNVKLDFASRLVLSPARWEHRYWNLTTIGEYNSKIVQASINDSLELYNNNTLYKNIRHVLKMLQGNETVCNTTCLESTAADVVLIDQKIAEAKHIGPKQIPLSKLTTLMDKIDLEQMIRKLYGNDSPGTKQNVTIKDWYYFETLNTIMKQTKPARIQNFLMWSVIRHYLPSLGKTYFDIYRSIKGFQLNRNSKEALMNYCMDNAYANMGYAVESLFITQKISAENRHGVGGFLNQTIAAFRSSLLWMTSNDTHRIESTLSQLNISTGSEQWVTDEQAVDKHYENLTIVGPDYFSMLLAAHRFVAVKTRSKASPKPGEFRFLPTHEFTKILLNMDRVFLLVPFGVLQLPLYNSRAPSAVNAAALGSLVLEKLFQHLLSENSRQMDNTTRERYSQMKQCAQEIQERLQRANETATESEWMKSFRVRSTLTQRMALSTAFNLHKDLLDLENDSNLQLPGLAKTSSDQLFFLSYTQSRCENVEPTVRGNTAYRVRKKMRINNLLMANSNFREAFSCHSNIHGLNSKQCKP